jgi:hypothetical protein
MSTTALYFTTPGQAQVQVSTANTALDGTGTLVQLVAGSSNGRRIARVRAASAVATPAAQKLTFFESTDGGATKRFLCDALLASSSAASATVRSVYTEVPELVGKVLGNVNNVLYVAAWIAQAANVTAEYNDA